MPTRQRTILSVTELNAEVNQLLNQGFPLLWVEGEISNLVRPSSGHLYFSLKDSKAQIRCAMFRNRNIKMKLKAENGMKVLVRGRVGLYEPRGDYQLIVEHMEDDGVGQLQKQYEALKQKLFDAGFFDNEAKHELPEYPQRIAIITSPTGAAIRDILHVLKRRSPHTPVLIYPVAVQGENAKNEIEAALRRADADKSCDVIILARGGGSIEDLWSFNEENVARTIFSIETPVICGVGHEIDFTIADFVADVRAPTPSAAAELVTPDRDQLLTDVIQTQLWLTQMMRRKLQEKQQQLDWLEGRLQYQQPLNKIKLKQSRIQELQARLYAKTRSSITSQRQHFNALRGLLSANQAKRQIKQKDNTLLQLKSRLRSAINSVLENRSAEFKLQIAMLNSLSPLNTLERGYAIVSDKTSGKLITSISQAELKQAVSVRLKDGKFSATIEELDKSE